MLTEHRSWSWYRPFDTLIVFLKDALKKFILKKKSADDNKSIKLCFYEWTLVLLNQDMSSLEKSVDEESAG